MVPFTTKGHKLLELLAAVGQLVAVKSSSVDAWVTESTNYTSYKCHCTILRGAAGMQEAGALEARAAGGLVW